MHHNSSNELTEAVTPVQNSNVARQSRMCLASRPRVRLHPVKTTPVTRSVGAQPFRVRIQPRVKQHDLIRRQLFPNVTPRKKRAHERVTIKLNCGRERTQPITSNARCDSDGSLSLFLRNCIAQADQRVHTFRTAVQTKQFTRRVLENNLIVRVIQRDGHLVFVEPIHSVANKTTKLAVLVSADALAVPKPEIEEIQMCMFIPHPWQTHNLRVMGLNNVDTLIVPYRVCSATRNEIQPALQSQALSQILDESVARATSPCLQLSRTHEGSVEVRKASPHTLEAFHKLSPHTMVVNLDVHVDHCFPHKRFAIIRDNVGELGILTAIDERNSDFELGEKHYFPNVHVLPQRITCNTVLQIVSLESSESHNQLVQCSQKTLFSFSMRKPE